ncbi:MAG: Bax protein [Roseivirga sp.]|jgi:Bax protein
MLQNCSLRLVGKIAGYFLVSVFIILSCSENQVIEENTNEELQVEFIELNSPDQILLIKDSLVKPILYSRIMGIDTLPTNEKKEKFIAAVLPAILVAKHRIKLKRAKVRVLLEKKNWTPQDSTFYLTLCEEYKTDVSSVLLNRMMVHPNSIILAQAIIESGWGSSRVFQEANNMFGIWSYSSKEPRIAAKYKREQETIYLRRYHDFSESIQDYFKTVARTNAYREFRRARLETTDPFSLVKHLWRYSERGEEYVIQLSSMIRFNELTRYDHYTIDPSYFQIVASN